MPDHPPPAPAQEGSSLGPLRHWAFAVLWTATVVANIGTWMQNAAASWLMTGLASNPLMVALVQVATTLPMFVFALPAGALADIVDRRRLLLVIQIAVTLWVAGFGLLVWSGRVTPAILLGFTFIAATFASLVAPAWQSIVPSLVPRRELQAAVALNSVGINISRAVGPALAGLIIAGVGMAAPFWMNSIATIGVIAALMWWHPPQGTGRRLPPERFSSAIRAGLRHARHNPHLRATLIRAAGFFVFASAYWALLPLVARDQVRGGPTLYGILLGTIGAGAVGGAFVLPWLKRRLGGTSSRSPGPSAPRSRCPCSASPASPQPRLPLASSRASRGSQCSPPSTCRPRWRCRNGCAAAASRSLPPSCSGASR